MRDHNAEIVMALRDCGSLWGMVGASLLCLAAAEAAWPQDVCAFYSQKLEAKAQCGAAGYPSNYGRKYCERFRDLQGLSAAGKLWRDGTLACLQKELEPFAKTGADCNAIRATAFASHGPCYRKSGFCALPTSDWLKIFQTIDWVDLLSGEGLKQIGNTLRDCYEKKVAAKQIDPASPEAAQLRAIIAALEKGELPTS